MKILGIDISKASISAVLLLHNPPEPRQFYYDADFHQFPATAQGIKNLLDLIGNDHRENTIAIAEPTGINYLQLWATHLARAGIEIRLVDHKTLKDYRQSHLQLPDKDDDADALALACYGWQYLDNPRKFIQIRDRKIVRIRELVLRLAHLNRIQSPIINRLRQDLAWQFPEAAQINSKRGAAGLPPLLFGWIAKSRKSARYDNLYARSCGLGLTDSARFHAARICDLQIEEMVIEKELSCLIENPEFLMYRKVFNKFGMGLRVQSLLLSQIYPIEDYLNPDGEPNVKVRKGRKSGKLTKRNLSIRTFQKVLGVAPTENSSGDMKGKRITGGSDLCRKAIWQWIFCQIELKKNYPSTAPQMILKSFIEAEKSTKMPIKLIRSRIAARAVRLLFKELVATFRKLPSPSDKMILMAKEELRKGGRLENLPFILPDSILKYL